MRRFWLVRRSALERYAVAVAFTAVGVLVRHLATPWFGASVPFLALYPALFLTGLIGGGGPAVLSTLLGAALALKLWMAPPAGFLPASSADVVTLAVFILTGLGISYVSHLLWAFNLDMLDAHREVLEQRRRAEQWIEQTQRGQRVIAAFSKSLTASEIISVILNEAMLAVGAKAGVVLRVVSEGRELEMAQAEGMPAEVVQAWRRFSVDHSSIAAALAVRTREALYVEDVDAWREQFPTGLTIAEQSGHAAMAVLPFVVAARVLGAIVLAFEAPRTIDSSDRMFLERLAHQCAVALERVNAYEAEQRARLDSERQRRRTEKLLRQSRRLQAVSAAFSRSLTTDDVTRIIIMEGLEAVSASAAFVSLLDETGQFLETVRSHGAPEEIMVEWRRTPLSMSPARAEVVRTGRPLAVADQQEWQSRYPETWNVGQRAGMNSFAMLPLTANDRVTGTFTLAFIGALPLDEDDRLFLDSLGRYCSIALERAQSYESERRARLEAEETNRLKDAFLATVSHELRTPLNAILGWAELLKRDVLPVEKRQRAVQAISDNAKRQAELTGDLLDMSRIIAGKVRLELFATDVGELVHSAVDVVQPAAEAKGIELIVGTEPLGRQWCDPGRIRQVLWNLLSNAVKFTPEHGRVEVTSLATPSFIEIAVQDSGEGIPRAFLPHVFEPFRQRDDTVTRRRGGLGLGLSIVKYLVELHGGTVAASSEGEGLGATFTVRLPVITRPVVREETLVGTPRADTASTDAPWLADVRVLIVENEADSREAMAISLRTYGADVFTAEDADGGRALLDGQEVDVLLVDIGLPGEDGYSLLRSVRAGHVRGRRSVPAAAITAYARPEDRFAASDAGFQEHLVKPIDGTTLARAVARLLASEAASIARPQA